MPNRFFVVTMFALLCLGCGNKSLKEFRDRYRWITGKWETKDGKTILAERWKWNKFRYEGEGFEIRGKDTVFREQLFIENISDHDCYIAVIPNQNPILFTAQKVRGGQWRFENFEHDFPGVIGYLPLSDTAIFVELMPATSPTEPQLAYTLKRKK